MTYENWVAEREWWKQRGPEAFEPVWRGLISAGYTPEQVAEMLDRVGYAMADEYGGSF